jgi:2-polyprenyl-3-methyl-5-hydroxy-6-metoxy-1,4-benzoquinol methylase
VSSCCSTFESEAAQQFNQKRVAKELARFRTKGPGPTTRLLEQGIAQAGVLGGSLLDVGAGFGALTIRLVERGMSGAIAVDASAAYIRAAQEEADRRGRAHSIRFVHGDFVSIAARLPESNVVALDRVVCCYPSCEALLDAAVGRAERCIALSYPREVWYVRLGMTAENAQRWVARNSFRTYVHPRATIEKTIGRAGFALSSRRETWMWSADVFVRR